MFFFLFVFVIPPVTVDNRIRHASFPLHYHSTTRPPRERTSNRWIGTGPWHVFPVLRVGPEVVEKWMKKREGEGGERKWEIKFLSGLTKFSSKTLLAVIAYAVFFLCFYPTPTPTPSSSWLKKKKKTKAKVVYFITVKGSITEKYM